jgi:hypothetical protein
MLGHTFSQIDYGEPLIRINYRPRGEDALFARFVNGARVG